MLELATRGASRWGVALCVTALSFAVLSPVTGCASDAAQAPPEQVQSDDDGRLEPRYEPREPTPKPFYNSDLLFGMTRGVTGSTIHPAAQVPLLVLTIPLDIVLLPFAAIGGFF